MSTPITDIYSDYGEIRSLVNIPAHGKGRDRKEKYEKTMKGFLSVYGEDIEASCAELAAAEDRQAWLASYGERFVDGASDHLKGFRGKVPAAKKMDATFFTIMFVLPLIRMTDAEGSQDLAQAACDAWSERFNYPDMRVADHKEILNSFSTKFLGIF